MNEYEIVYLVRGESEERKMQPGNRKAAEEHLAYLRGQFGIVCADLWHREVGAWKQISKKEEVADGD